MASSIKRIGIILVAVILLPALFFSIYELNSLTQNETAVERIYEEQLGAVLSSVNIYANDIAFDWSEGINTSWSQSKGQTLEEFERLLKTFPACKAIGIYNLGDSKLEIMESNSDSVKKDNFIKMLEEVGKENEPLLNKLCEYAGGGYRKIEGIDQSVFPHLQLLTFALDDSLLTIGTLLINPNIFASQNLGPRMQGIAREEFILGIIDSANNQVVYSTDSILQEDFQYQKSVWIFPEHELGIAFKGTTIRELILNRFYVNLILLLVLNGVIIFATWLVFKNIRKEIELAQVKSEFVSNVSHEIRTPLALISMFAETLEMDRVATKEKRYEYYRIISQEARRLGGIVNKILHFSQTEAKKRFYHFEMIDLNEILHDISYAYQYHLEQSGFTVEITYASDLPYVTGDAESLSEATINLLENAIKYSLETEKYIRLSTSLSDGYAVIAVKDKGIGIAKEHHKAIFGKFYRVSEGGVHNVKGTGLGLSLVQNIVKAHKGIVRLNSELGKGSEFSIFIPIAKEKIR